MRDPRRMRAFGIVALAAAASAAAVVFFVLDDAQRTARGLVGAAAILFGLFGAIATVTGHLDARGRDRLLRGEGILARWIVSPDEWRRFVEQEPARSAQLLAQTHRSMPNIVRATTPPPDEGVEVVIAREAAMVNGEFQALPRRGVAGIIGPLWVEGSPHCLEFRLNYGHGANDYYTFRFPVPADAITIAEAARQHYLNRHGPRRPPNPRRWRIVRNISALVALGGIVVLTIAIRREGNVADEPGFTFLGSMMAASFGSVFTLAGAVRARRS